MSPMKVINIILEPRIGGPQLRIALVAKYLKEHFGIETLVVFPEKKSGEYKNLLDKMGVAYRSLRLHKLSKNPGSLLQWFISLAPETVRLKKIIREEAPDLVHCNGSWQWKGVWAAKSAGCKVVWHLNDTGILLPVKWLLKLWLPLADGFITAGSRVKSYYLGNFKLDKPLREIQAPVDTAIFNPEQTSAEESMKRYRGVKIITVGNINACKGIEYLIDAAALLNTSRRDLHFVVVGKLLDTQRGYIEKLKKKIKNRGLENVYFWGGSSQIPGLLAAADIYVCPSVTEASPLSVWEAMAMEKAVVSTDVGSVPDFIREGENGFVVPTRDPEKLAGKISALIDDPGLRKTMGKKARETAVKELDIRITAGLHKDIYEKILQTGTPAQRKSPVKV